MTDPLYMTMPQVCRKLGKSRHTVYRLIEAGQLHPEPLPGLKQRQRFLRSEVEALAAKIGTAPPMKLYRVGAHLVIAPGPEEATAQAPGEATLLCGDTSKTWAMKLPQ